MSFVVFFLRVGSSTADALEHEMQPKLQNFKEEEVTLTIRNRLKYII